MRISQIIGTYSDGGAPVHSASMLDATLLGRRENHAGGVVAVYDGHAVVLAET